MRRAHHLSPAALPVGGHALRLRSWLRRDASLCPPYDFVLCELICPRASTISGGSLRHINLTGKSPKTCPVPRTKIFRFSSDPNQRLFPLPSRPGKRGGSRVVTNAGRDAVDAGSVRREACSQGGFSVSGHGAQDDRRCGVRQNRVVLAPVAGVKLPVAHSIQPDRLSHQAGSDGGKRNSSPGRARHKPSNHCAGNAGVLRLYLYARVRTSSCTLHTRPRVQQAPGIPCSLSLGGRLLSKPRARSAPRERKHTFNCHRPA